MNETERQEWNAAVARGDKAEIDRLRKRILTAISLKIMTEDDYQGRTH